MKINKAFKYRIYPNKKQIEYIEECFNACRYVYNVSLDCEKQLYELGAKSNLSAFGLSYHLKYYKISSPWLKKADSIALVYEMENLASAYKKFFSGGGYPKFKSKRDKQSFRTRQDISLDENGLKIPKLTSYIDTVLHRPLEGKLKQVTISRECGKYYVSAMCEIEKEIPVLQIKKEVGIDLGVSHFLTTDEGEKIENPRFLVEHTSHLRKLQQNLSRTKKGSKNREKIKNKIAELYRKITNKRSDFLHNASAKLISDFDRVYMEDLSVSKMTKSAKGSLESPGENVKQKSSLNKSILDVGLGNFASMLDYKARFSGKEVVKVDKYFASSKICNSCGNRNEELALSDRTWDCSNCGARLDRDTNAAKNIKAEGRKKIQSLRK